MEAYPNNYNKKTFIEYLKKNHSTSSVAERFEKLPVTVTHNDIEYRLNIVKTYYAGGGSFYNFELNYYSDESLEFLFTYKIFQDVEDSVRYLECELLNGNFISKETNCHD